MKKILDYLYCYEFGLLELLVAFYPLICGYKVGGIPMSQGFVIILALISIVTRGIRPFRFKPFILFGCYVVVHNLIYACIIDGVSSASGFVNNTIGMAILVVCCRFISPVIEYKKLWSGIVVISIICILGLLYHASQLAMGNLVSTIPIPFMPDQGAGSRLLEDNFRPSSFFFEPQSYVMYMLVPLFLFLRERRYSVCAVIGITILLSGSTTGIALLAILVFMFMLQGGISIKNKIIILAFFCGASLFLLNSKYTQIGLEKLETTQERGGDLRVSNGPALFADVAPIYYITGAPYTNATNMARKTSNSNVVFVQDNVFIPSFWIALVFYGFIGLYFFMNIYWTIWKKNKEIRPYVACLIACTFSNPDFLGATMIYALMFMLSFIDKKDNKLAPDFNLLSYGK